MPDCCWYLVFDVPPGCTEYEVDMIVTLPCQGTCVDRYVGGSGPCADVYLSALFPDCQPCDLAASPQGRQLLVDAKARNPRKVDRSKAKPLKAEDLAAMRNVAL